MSANYPKRDRDVARAVLGALSIVLGAVLVISAGGRVNGGIVFGLPIAAFGFYLFTEAMSALTEEHDEEEREDLEQFD